MYLYWDVLLIMWSIIGKMLMWIRVHISKILVCLFSLLMLNKSNPYCKLNHCCINMLHKLTWGYFSHNLLKDVKTITFY